jgi:hypothetical protein
MSSRKDTARVNTERILHVEDQLLEEVPVPYQVVGAAIGRRPVARVRLVACCAAADSLDIYSDGERVQASVVESSHALDGRRVSIVAMVSKDDR